MAELTPMMQQYYAVKERNPDGLLFFRLGDFYEMFEEDARIASRELDLTLTSRDHAKDKSAEDKIPMCGVPYHSSESYIARLVAKGYKVAICEQMEDPALAKGLVKRDIIRIVTPGSVTESSMLVESKNNYYACVYGAAGTYGLCFCDVSTGAFSATQVSGADAMQDAQNELGSFLPSEALLGGTAAEDSALADFLRDRFHTCVNIGTDAQFDPALCEAAVTAQFGQSPEALGLANMPCVIAAAGALLTTLRDLQKNELPHIRALELYIAGKFMQLDLAARRNLELTETMRAKEKRGSLLWVLDKTKTAMGGRLLRAWMERPLLSPAQITRRLTAVEELVKKTIDREELILSLREITDFERAMTRIMTGTASCRDLAALSQGAASLPAVKERLSGMRAPYLQTLFEQLDTLADLKEKIDATIVDDPPFLLREGGLIRDGANKELDELRAVQSGGKGMLTQIEAREKEKTGIRNLRVGYNRVFGYYIEVAKGQLNLVPDSYIRKQTLVNGERYITQELKDLEQEILTAGERVNALEYELFSALRDEVCACAERIQKTAAAVAELDTLAALASVAVKNNYCCPVVDDSGVIELHDGRHPVVERVLKDTLFVPNDTYMGETENRVAIITGPNMAGKSTYMRQVALITLMAQIGSFVPARAARIGVVDRIFTRIGASDDLAGGQSTFMVEMSEVAEILRQASAHSLLILDEIGRGTSTFDGMSIARAVLEFCAERKKLGAKTLFATHYHELTELEGTLSGVKNYNIAIKKRGEDLVFLRKIIPGGADRSYGIEVAKLAGLPREVVSRAKKILEELEAGGSYIPPREEREQVSLEAIGEAEALDALRRAQIDTMTPIEAMQLLYDLKKKLQD